MMDSKLVQANARLKTSQVAVRIEVKGQRLYLRATLPAKPGDSNQQQRQQRIAIGYHVNPAGLKLAEKAARKVGALLECGEFDWAPYLREPVSKPDDIAAWVDRFEVDYFTRRQRSPKSETTWQDDYLKVFSRMPPDEPLTLELLRRTIAATPPDTRTRRRFVDVLTRLAQFAGLEPDFKPLKGHYSPARVSPRSLPTDGAIAAFWGQIPNEGWQRVYGLLATYGLRPHEVFHCDFEKFPIVQVGADTKTGQRRIWPLYPEWCDSWSLAGELPVVTGKTNSDLGNRVTKALRRYGLSFAPYNLRHAWAVRSMEFGLDISLAAQQMGHSVRVHSECYHHWITDEVHDRAYQVLMERSDRPLPPGS